MLQSCGRSTVCHAWSSNPGSVAPGKSPRENFQPASKDVRREADFAALAAAEVAPSRPSVAATPATAAVVTKWRRVTPLLMRGLQLLGKLSLIDCTAAPRPSSAAPSALLAVAVCC